MYLLDNKNSLEINELNKIYQIKTKEELINLSENDFSGIDYFFNKLSHAMFSTKFYNNDNNLNNLKKLFLNPPLSMDEKSEEFEKIINYFKDQIKATNKMSWWDTSGYDLLIVYKELLIEKIKEGKISSYDIVGDTTRNFNNLLYSKSLIKPEDMDLFLYEVEKINPLKSKKIEDINEENINEKLKNLEKKLNLESNTTVTSFKFEEIYEKIKNKKPEKLDELNEIIKNKNLETKRMINYIFKELNSTALNKLTSYKVYNSFSIYSPEKFTYQQIKSTLEDIVKKELKDDNLDVNKVKEVLKYVNITENVIVDKYNKILIENNFLEKANNNNFELNVKNIKEILYKEKNELYKEYVDIKKDFINILNKDEDFLYLNKQYMLKKFSHGKYNQIKEVMIDIINNIDLKKFSINEIKQLLYIELSDNKTIYNLAKNTNFFNDLSKNSLIKSILNENSIEVLKKVNFKRVKYVASILINKEDLDKLFTSDIRINIKDRFYEKFNTIIDEKESNEKLNEIYKIFNQKQNELNYNKSNILLGMIIESYDVNQNFDKNKFDKLYKATNTPINKLNEEQKTIINSIEDKWLKWGVCFNREIKDNNLTFSDLNPLDFDFSKMQTIKKIFQEKFDKNQELTTKDYNLIEFLINKNQKENFDETFEKFKELFELKNKSFYNEKNKEKFNYLFYKNIKHIVENKNDNIFKKHIDDTLNNFFKSKEQDIDNQIKNIFSLNKAINMHKNINSYNCLIPFEKILNFVNKNFNRKQKWNNFLNDLNTFKKIKENNLLEIFINNLNTTIKLDSRKIDSYINYFETMKKTDSFKNYKEEDSLIPIISKDIGNGYSYKVKTIKEFDILLTGEKTNCCMTYGNAGWNIYKYMYENPKENVIFEVYKDGEPIANSWTWYKDEKICFDNIEVLGKELRDNVIKAYQDAALDFVVNYNIKDVNFGVSHSDIDVNKLGNGINQNIPNKHLNCYTDASNQLGIVSLSNNIKNMENSLIKLKNNNEDLFTKYINKLNKIYNLDFKELIKDKGIIQEINNKKNLNLEVSFE